jgi:hypothetical protein
MFGAYAIIYGDYLGTIARGILRVYAGYIVSFLPSRNDFVEIM